LYELTPERVVLIPPETHYTSRLREDRVRHFFVHFQLGKPYDKIQPGIFDFEVTDHIRGLIEELRRWANRSCDPASLLILGELVFHLLRKLDADRWPQHSVDERIEQALSVGLADLSQRKSNEELARAAHMSTNAFIRRFRQVLGQAPQTYLTHRRIEQARHLLAQTDATIEQIAESCGFAGRSHFSTVFARETGMGPGGYRKSAQP
jgi:AraC-like DNA-binding protein